MKAINKINDVITSVLKVICMILVALMTIVIFLQIFCRLFFTPLLWSEEASRIMMIWLIFLGSVLLYNMPRNGHIKVESEKGKGSVFFGNGDTRRVREKEHSAG